ncbi:hypothetical protein F0726_00013 [Acidithiobacillus caldus]|nr:hypothetical protein F0726_00013 [Acidithiobacillus caldus]
MAGYARETVFAEGIGFGDQMDFCQSGPNDERMF